TGTRPGSELVNWRQVPQGAAIWSWGRITGLSNIIARNLAGSVAIGDMTGFNGITAPFDGQFGKVTSQCAFKTTSGGFVAQGDTISISGYVGKNFTASGLQQIKQATVYPSTDRGFGFNQFMVSGSPISGLIVFTLNLRGKTTVPGSPGDGILLGS